jgi:hypothetical protein|tara:strand:- start:2424 stop:2906 length:483 start_codon:yes stop_codon:yes gene_type:complete
LKERVTRTGRAIRGDTGVGSRVWRGARPGDRGAAIRGHRDDVVGGKVFVTNDAGDRGDVSFRDARTTAYRTRQRNVLVVEHAVLARGLEAGYEEALFLTLQGIVIFIQSIPGGWGLRRGGEEAGVGEGQFVSTAESEGKKRVARGPRAKGLAPAGFLRWI